MMFSLANLCSSRSSRSSRSLRSVAAAIALVSLCARAAAAEDSAEASVVRFYTGIRSASEAARADDGLVFVVFAAQWCDPCNAFEKDVLESNRFKRDASPLHVVRVDVDVSKDDARLFGVNAVPNLVFMTAIGKIVDRRIGGMDVAELLAWLEQSRKADASGLWYGVVPEDAQAAPASDRSKRQESVEDLAGRLGSNSPGTRAEARKALMARGKRAVPHLISVLKSEYLGLRIGADDTLRRMLSDEAPSFDPWASKTAREALAEGVATWWEGSPELRPATEERGSSAAGNTSKVLDRTTALAIANVLTGDPVKRTGGMTALIEAGMPAMDAIRGAIRKCQKTQDDDSRSALQEVRWSILIPYSIETRLPGTRVALARGSAQRRRQCANELKGGGTHAIPALAELVRDPDNLVREAALHVLSSVRGPGALEAMASLLKADDANLRMTAAQSLGHTKNASASKHIATALEDPDEVVVCAAIAALEEVKASDQKDALLKSLKDERWRVRAAAAEAIGKLKVTAAKDGLKRMLDDPDDFVVKHVLDALNEMSVKVEYATLKPVITRIPAVTDVALKILLDKDTPSDIKTAETIFDDAPAAGQAAVFERLAEMRNYEKKKDDYWKSLIDKGASSDHTQVRLACAKALRNRSPVLSREYVGKILSDDDLDVREEGALLVLHLAAQDWGILSGGLSRISTLMLDAGTEWTASSGPGADDEAKTKAEKAAAEFTEAKKREHREALAQHLRWHVLLKERAGDKPSVPTAWAIYATGDGKSDLPLLQRSFQTKDLSKKVDYSLEESGVPLLVKRLPWPESEAFVESACEVPFTHALLLKHAKWASVEVKDMLIDERRLMRSLTSADHKDLARLLRPLLQPLKDSAASLHANTESSKQTVEKLADSPKGELRAAAAFIRGSLEGDDSLAALEASAKDSDAHVRAMAAGAIARRLSVQEQREAKLAPLLKDDSPLVVKHAAVGLLLAEVAEEGDLQHSRQSFTYGDDLTVWGSSSYSTSTDRPLRPIRRKPEFLEQVRKLVVKHADSKTKDSEAWRSADMMVPLALLLAQYGDATGLKYLVEQHYSDEGAKVPSAVIAAIALAESKEHLGILRRAAAAADSSYEVRKLLKAVRGMNGREARAFRRDLNKRIREMGTH